MTAQLPYGLRIALAFGDALLAERMVTSRRAVTIGHASSCTFVLPSLGLKGRRVLAKLGRKKATLHLLDDFDGQVTLDGQARSLDELRSQGRTSVELQPEDWAILVLRDAPSVRVVVQRVQPEPLPAFTRQRGERPSLYAMTGLSALMFGLLMAIAYLDYDPNPPELTVDDIDERFARAMFNRPPQDEQPPEDEPEVSDEDKPEEKARKRAGGPEGVFGRPDRTGRSNIPRNAAETPGVEQGKVGIVKELDVLAQKGAMGDLLGVGGQLGGLDEGEFVVGAGNYGASTRGSGNGGGGEGEGVIHGTGDVDVGGTGVGNRKRQVKGTAAPKEKKVSVSTGSPSVTGQLSKELIDREVRRHRAQIEFCYNKQLTRHPNLSGKVTLHWIIAMDGSVKGAKVKSSSLGNGDAESCMVRALGSWKFPKPEGGVVTVDYPFFFRPQ